MRPGRRYTVLRALGAAGRRFLHCCLFKASRKAKKTGRLAFNALLETYERLTVTGGKRRSVGVCRASEEKSALRAASGAIVCRTLVRRGQRIQRRARSARARATGPAAKPPPLAKETAVQCGSSDWR
jgi:hypothetical protein